MADQFNDIFNPQGITEAPVRPSEVYRPTYKDKKCKNGTYDAIIRFVPFYLDPSNNSVRKYTTYVVNPVTSNGMYVDDPRSVNEHSPVTDMFFKMRNTGIAQFSDAAKKYLGSRLNCASIVQIMKDDQHPELVGQLRVFTYGQKILDMLNSEEHPKIGQGINPFHPILGRKFLLSIKEKAGFANYDDSMFYDDQTGNAMWVINPATNQFEILTDANRDLLMPYLTANSPDLNKYKYQPWTDEQQRHVQETLNIIQGMINSGTVAIPQQYAGQMAAAQGFGAGVASPSMPGMIPVNNTPGVSAQPAAPATPATPIMSGVPGVPAAPAQGGIVTTQSAPVTPAAPVMPGVPAAPAAPATPATPVVPNMPGIPAAPAAPAAPSVPAMPGVPTQPAAPAAPVMPGVPQQPGVVGVEIPVGATPVTPQQQPTGGIDVSAILKTL